jgi:hypothetical protein
MSWQIFILLIVIPPFVGDFTILNSISGKPYKWTDETVFEIRTAQIELLETRFLTLFDTFLTLFLLIFCSFY